MNYVSDKEKQANTKVSKIKKKGSEIILDVLMEQSYREVFGYPGGCVLPLFDELINYPELKLILVRHEQAATHAADGMARLTGKAGIVIVTSGPGATNTITGLATAMMDSIPMVVISGQVRRAAIGTDAFQETNVVGVSRPVTKQNYLVKNIADLKRTLREAFYIAESGRPGPVLVDIPVDIQKEFYEYTAEEDNRPVSVKGYNPHEEDAGEDDINEAWKMIAAAKRPLLYVGGGVLLSNASKELMEFAEKADIPVSTTLLGMGGFPESHRLACGMLGMHGTYCANRAMMETDCAVAIGARFDDRVTGDVDEFLKDSKIIHVDIDPSSIGKVKTPDIGIRMDARKFLNEINKIAHPLELKKWNEDLDGFKRDFPLPEFDPEEQEESLLHPEFIVKKLSDITNGDAVIVTDVGQHQMFVALHYKWERPGSHLTSGGLGTMGYSLPAAMGAAFVEKEKPVISISGDGGFQMNLQELATIREMNIPVKIIIFNNRNLGMVHQWQEMFYNERFSSSIFDKNPDFIRLAEAYDISSERVTKADEVEPAIKRMLAHQGPCLVEFRLRENSRVYPMIPSGEPLKNIRIGNRLGKKTISDDNL